MNHPTVMFKKNKIISAGNYRHMPFFEDYYLWLRCKKIRCGNSEEKHRLEWTHLEKYLLKSDSSQCADLYKWLRSDQFVSRSCTMSHLHKSSMTDPDLAKCLPVKIDITVLRIQNRQIRLSAILENCSTTFQLWTVFKYDFFECNLRGLLVVEKSTISNLTQRFESEKY